MDYKGVKPFGWQVGNRSPSNLNSPIFAFQALVNASVKTHFYKGLLVSIAE